MESEKLPEWYRPHRSSRGMIAAGTIFGVAFIAMAVLIVLYGPDTEPEAGRKFQEIVGTTCLIGIGLFMIIFPVVIGYPGLNMDSFLLQVPRGHLVVHDSVLEISSVRDLAPDWSLFSMRKGARYRFGPITVLLTSAGESRSHLRIWGEDEIRVEEIKEILKEGIANILQVGKSATG